MTPSTRAWVVVGLTVLAACPVVLSILGHVSPTLGGAVTSFAVLVAVSLHEWLDRRVPRRTTDRCALCGDHQSKVSWLVVGEQAAICGRCIQASAELLEQRSPRPGPPDPNPFAPPEA